MQLKIKSRIVSISVTTVFVLLSVLFINFVVLKKFQELEDQRVGRNIKVLEFVLEDRVNQLSAKLIDWSSWDDTYKYIEDKNKVFETSNLSKDTFVQLGVDEVFFVNSSGVLATKFTAKDGLVTKEVTPDDLYIIFMSQNSGNGLVRTSTGLNMYASKDILKSDNSGPSRGRLVFIRQIDTEILKEMKALTQFDVAIADWQSPVLSDDFRMAKKEFESGKKSVSIILDDQIIAGYVLISDATNKSQAIIRVKVTRDIAVQGVASMTLLTIILLSSGFLTVVIYDVLFNNLVLKRIWKISDEVADLTGAGRSVRRLEMSSNRGDEIDGLRVNINKMLDSIQTAQIAIENSSNHVVLTDTEGVIVFANHAAEKMTGFTFKEMAGNTPRLWGGQMSRKYYEEMWKKIKIDKEVFSGEINNKRKSGEIYTALATISPVLDDKNNLKGFVGVEEDITEKKIAEKIKEQTLERLERLNKLMVGRELKMIELKDEMKKLKKTT